MNTTFKSLGLPPSLLLALQTRGFEIPTPIQAQAIPPLLEGRDVIGIAQTGTGKTLAFALPLLTTLSRGEQVLVLAPTRELAAQIEEEFAGFRTRTALLIGGAPMGRQVSALRSHPDVIVATPGRLEDHLAQGSARLDRIVAVVLDEADRMLDMGFAPAMRRILGRCPRERQTLLFSATMPKEIEGLANDYLVEPIKIEIAPQGTSADTVDQELIVVDRDAKPDMLRDLLHEHRDTVLVFSRTRHGARKLAKGIRLDGHTAAELHADRTLAQRKDALHGFKNGAYRVLVATDIAARGIDVKEIGLVLNYDVPEHAEDYVHRIGRTGRAGHRGRAVTLVSPDQSHEVRDIERLLRTEIPLSGMSPLPFHRQPKPTVRTGEGAPRRRQGGSRRPR